MNNETRVTMRLANEAGTVSNSEGLNLQVSFDLIELQVLVGGVADRIYCYGCLRFRNRLEPSIMSLLRSQSRLTLTGDGIQTDLCLHGLNSFSVMGTIREMREGGEAKRQDSPCADPTQPLVNEELLHI